MRALAAAALLLLAGCEEPQRAKEMVAARVAPVVELAQAAAAEAVVFPVLLMQATVQEATSPPAEACVAPIDPAAAKLIVRWEVTSPQAYERKYRRPIWPGGASGVTWGVGYDGGHQTKTAISRDWSSHPSVTALSRTSGIVGMPAKQLAGSMQDVQTPFPAAEQVFVCSTLPAYRTAARRALGPAFEKLPPKAAGSLVSLGYNRGWSFKGKRRTEMATIRNECVPAGDTACIARELKGMCRHWAGTPNGKGLCDRRHDEARLATQ